MWSPPPFSCSRSPRVPLACLSRMQQQPDDGHSQWLEYWPEPDFGGLAEGVQPLLHPGDGERPSRACVCGTCGGCQRVGAWQRRAPAATPPALPLHSANPPMLQPCIGTVSELPGGGGTYFIRVCSLLGGGWTLNQRARDARSRATFFWPGSRRARVPSRHHPAAWLVCSGAARVRGSLDTRLASCCLALCLFACPRAHASVVP